MVRQDENEVYAKEGSEKKKHGGFHRTPLCMYSYVVHRIKGSARIGQFFIGRVSPAVFHSVVIRGMQVDHCMQLLGFPFHMTVSRPH